MTCSAHYASSLDLSVCFFLFLPLSLLNCGYVVFFIVALSLKFEINASHSVIIILVKIIITLVQIYHLQPYNISAVKMTVITYAIHVEFGLCIMEAFHHVNDRIYTSYYFIITKEFDKYFKYWKLQCF